MIQSRKSRYILSTNALDIGILYAYFGICFGIIGGSYSFLIRLELGNSGIQFIRNSAYSDLYNNIITNHGLIMIFLMVIPLIIGSLGNIMIPILIGSIDMIYSRLNNISFLLLLPGSLLILMSSFINKGYGTGWTMYVNLSLLEGHWDLNVDLLILSLHTLGISSLLGSINFIVSIIINRHVGLNWYLLSLYSWTIYITSILILVSIPILGVGITMILLDRNINTNYYIYQSGGSLILYQNIFWFFGHIEVYFIVLVLVLVLLLLLLLLLL